MTEPAHCQHQIVRMRPDGKSWCCMDCGFVWPPEKAAA
jgi:hypothetical protein